MYVNIIMIIKIFVVSILLIIIMTIITGCLLLLDIKEGMRDPIDRGWYNLTDIKDFTPLDLAVNSIPQSSSITEFAKSCVEKGPPDIATLLITGSSGDYVAHYSKVKIDPNAAYSKIKTLTGLEISKTPTTPPVSTLESESESESQSQSQSQSQPQPQPTAIPAIPGQMEARDIVLKHSILSNSPKDKTHISAKSDATTNTTLWEYNGGEKWNLYAKKNKTGEFEGTLICNSNNKCITSHNRSSNLGKNVNLIEKPSEGSTRTLWKLTKHDDKYTICTRVNLDDNKSNLTHLCLEPWIENKFISSPTKAYKGSRLTPTPELGARIGYDESNAPPNGLLWELKELPENFMKK